MGALWEAFVRQLRADANSLNETAAWCECGGNKCEVHND